eukprot:1198714-Pleurochrysis_carterae.AAC.1
MEPVAWVSTFNIDHHLLRALCTVRLVLPGGMDRRTGKRGRDESGATTGQGGTVEGGRVDGPDVRGSPANATRRDSGVQHWIHPRDRPLCHRVR